MSVQFRGRATTVNLTGPIAGVSDNGSVQVEPRGIDVLTGGAFRICTPTVDISTIAARTATAGHLFAFRNPSSSTLCIIQRIRAAWFTNAGFTAAQLVGLSAYVVRPFTIAYSGGAAVTVTNPQLKKRTSHGVSIADIRYSTGPALTGSATNTFDTLPIALGYFSELAAGAAVPKGFFEIEWNAAAHGQDQPIVLAQNEGIVVANEILMGAGGTARVTVEVDWVERDTF